MTVDEKFIENVLAEFALRMSMIKAAGGVSMKEVAEGKKIPDGFIHDCYSDWFYPASLFLDEKSRMQ